MPNRYTLLLPQTLYQAMVEQAIAELPNECCGLLAGALTLDRVRAVQHFPLVNSATSPTVEYLSEPRSILDAHKAMRSRGLEEIAVYHSHPTSDAIPSRKDRAENAYGDSLMHLIISLKTGQPVLQGWWLCDDGFEEGKWEFAEDDGVVPDKPTPK